MFFFFSFVCQSLLHYNITRVIVTATEDESGDSVYSYICPTAAAICVGLVVSTATKELGDSSSSSFCMCPAAPAI